MPPSLDTVHLIRRNKLVKNILDLEFFFKFYIQKKVILEIFNDTSKRINFQKEINEIFQLLRENKHELYEDLK